MAILVTGSTGTIGSQVVAQLATRGADVLALTRSPDKARFPEGVTAVKGDFTDVESMRSALSMASTLFLLNAVTPDEVTQALIALNLARSADIERIVYLSVFHSDLYTNVPHFAGKFTVERMIEQYQLPVTILRPAYFIQNDITIKDVIAGYGVYPMPVGSIGLSMVDTRDIAEVAALELLRRERSSTPLPGEVVNVVGPDVLNGAQLARLWSEVLNREIAYGGDDSAAFEQNMKAFAPDWMAYDMRLMTERFQQDGMVASVADTSRLTKMLDRPLRSYREFAEETAQQLQPG
ncbi:SDR family oxidoreductase [Sphingomonas sp. LaA6.9]|uniref:SDR family oxidoreductase n=1 Tax=Sphingomonas sp. LaA6.9 TaxID=2919914 RepID=UPI001F50052F|nr:NmrA family NAD(P)-binding protein [Sphingomonas sp. LaA6.9]MCJ8159001.1 NmrA family NAD(P)-binding protein [Sphingomonas sp. LaA6.9]